MSEQIKKLEELLFKINNTWQLLDIDGRVVEMHKAEEQMKQTDFWANPENAKVVGKKHDALKQEIDTWVKIKEETENLLSLSKDLEKNPDESLVFEINVQTEKIISQFNKLEFYLLFNGKHDTNNALVSFHAGSGGTEAQDWTEMLRRMIVRFCEKRSWSVTVLDESWGSEAGLKSSVLRIEGRFAYGYLKSESGTHRLVRISPFDAEKMRHTSFSSIEVIPEIESGEVINIDPKELRIDTFMSGGKGGQSVNTTYSAVRIVHIPTGITVQCQNERSQLQNKETALKILQSKLQKLKEEEEEKEKQDLRGEYKSAEWGNQIRSYVLHPYKLVKDVRTKFETTDPEAVLNGELEPFIETYLRWSKDGKTFDK